MSSETKATLDQSTVEAVQELIEINIDSYNGFTQASSETAAYALPQMFDELAKERLDQAAELQQLIIANDEEPISEGSVAGRIHRTIMDWRDALGSGPKLVLKEVERGEDYIKAKYEAVLARTADSAVTDTLNVQYEAVKKALNRVRGLRDTVSAS